MAAFCEHCGKELSDLAISCPSCGHPRRSAGAAITVGARRMEPYAIVSLCCAIGNFVVLPVVGAILGIVFGNMALDRIRQDPSLDGEGMAQAGRVIGYIGLALTALFILAFMGFCAAMAGSVNPSPPMPGTY